MSFPPLWCLTVYAMTFETNKTPYTAQSPNRDYRFSYVRETPSLRSPLSPSPSSFHRHVARGRQIEQRQEFTKTNSETERTGVGPKDPREKEEW